MKQKHFFLCWLVITWIAAALLRFWNLHAGYDAEGLPITGHISVYFLAAISALILITYLLLSAAIRRKNTVAEIPCSQPCQITACAGAALILVSAIAEFLSTDSNMIVAVILLVLGTVSGLCLIVNTVLRSRGSQNNRIAVLIPICYLLVKLIINFKGWSIDPIILDYCIRLFAMISILLAFYYIAGFTFQIVCPARSYFFAAAGCYFGAAAVMEGILNHSVSDILFYLGCFLWMLHAVLHFTPDSVREA